MNNPRGYVSKTRPVKYKKYSLSSSGLVVIILTFGSNNNKYNAWLILADVEPRWMFRDNTA